jgi:hypothetical protein
MTRYRLQRTDNLIVWAPVVDVTTAVRGPQVVERPATAVDVNPGNSIQSLTNSRPAGTTFWLREGVHQITSSTTPKSGNTYLGQMGAVIDGTGWASNDLDDAAFKALNQNIDDVTVKNLEIRNMPSYGVQAYRDFSDRWTVDSCYIHHCRNGVGLPSASIITNNKITHCVGTMNTDPGYRGGGYSIGNVDDVVFSNNEVAFCGFEQKFLMCERITCTGNWFHHNLGDGFWIDGEGQDSIIDGNVCDDNGRTGMTLEMGVGIVLRNNLSRRNGTSGLLVTMSRGCDIYGNTLEFNEFDLDLFLNCDTLSEGFPWLPDLTNNRIHDNNIRTGAWPKRPVIALMLSGGTCAGPYISNAKLNTFANNNYTTAYGWGGFTWFGAQMTWEQWQAFGQDVGGTRVIG